LGDVLAAATEGVDFEGPAAGALPVEPVAAAPEVAPLCGEFFFFAAKAGFTAVKVIKKRIEKSP
jgi:hypothetical protein